MRKRKYIAPVAEKVDFDYTETIVASSFHHGDVGHGVGIGGGCDHKPGHGTPKTPHP